MRWENKTKTRHYIQILRPGPLTIGPSFWNSVDLMGNQECPSNITLVGLVLRSLRSWFALCGLCIM